MQFWEKDPGQNLEKMIDLTSKLGEINMIYSQYKVRAIPEKSTWEGKTAGNIFFYGWLVPKVFKLYGSLVFDQI